jgi:hypothetical protein
MGNHPYGNDNRKSYKKTENPTIAKALRYSTGRQNEMEEVHTRKKVTQNRNNEL